jgi:hypothetical protein
MGGMYHVDAEALRQDEILDFLFEEVEEADEAMVNDAWHEAVAFYDDYDAGDNIRWWSGDLAEDRFRRREAIEVYLELTRG